MKRQKFQPSSTDQQQALGHTQNAGKMLEFDSAEKLLRHDALHTPVPPSVASRLQESLARLAPERRPWWRRLFGS